MGYIAVDLGSTNIKVAVYDDLLRLKSMMTRPVNYIKASVFVEFDAVDYCKSIKEMISAHIKNGSISAHDVRKIVFTGQAESLVVLDGNGKPLMNAISWMDERSSKECEYLSSVFSREEFFQKTGQMAVLPTWPATKILWLRNNKRDVFANAEQYVLLKDYVVYYFTGQLFADCSIATFTFYFDILNKCYWAEMLEACGIRLEQLPPLKEPCTSAGTLLYSVAEDMGLSESTTVNIGTLDHFAGMIGTGNVQKGIVSLSTGTVMALAAMAEEPLDKESGLAVHYGFMPDTYILLPVAESGGICLEWFRKNFMNNISYGEINDLITKKENTNELLFLPYIVGTNAPELEADTCGIFYGIRAAHDSVDLAYAVMEGVAFLLAKNVDAIRSQGIKAERIIATGGGSKSDIWCQLKANATGVPVEIPAEKEAACLGAAIIGAVEDGVFSSYKDAALSVIRITKRFMPETSDIIKQKRIKFDLLYETMLKMRNE